MNIVRNILIILVVLIAVLVVARNVIIRSGVERGIQAVTGLRLEIGALDIGLFKPEISVKNLKLYNPEGVQEPLMADVGEIYVRYKPGELLKGTAALSTVRFHLNQFNVVRQPGKGLNLDALKALQPKGDGGPPPKFSIDDLTLAVGTVTYKDYTPSPPAVQQFALNLNEHYTNIRDPNELVRLIVVSALQRTSIANLAQFNLKNLKQTLSSTLLNTLKAGENPIKGLLNNLHL